MKKVLVVDDQAMARDMAAFTLRREGYEVVTAADGREALDVLGQGDCRLVVTDWDMPVMDGLELCRAVRGGNFRGYVYLILLTSNNKAQNTVEGLAAGADDYIAKPFNPAELVMRVNVGRRIIGLETRDVAIFAMAKLAESRDSETGTHLERVRSYCRCLAKRLHREGKFPDELDDQFVQLIYETSPLHDIGKVAIPDAVLLKPGKLTEEEVLVMRAHTLEGAKTLQAALDQFPGARFLKLARDIAISHHEKYDGSGYPRGLAGEAIPLCGRIVAVADVYDALTSRRVYKPARSHEESAALIVTDAGRHFDPTVVAAFEAEQETFRRIRADYEAVEAGRTPTPVA